MANKVGEKGQVVIDKAIRDRLGIGPGWLAIQRIVDDHVEIYFVTPEHNRSLAGSLSEYVTEETKKLSWDEMRQRAWAAAAAEREERLGVEVDDRRS
jgi:AbrB family looped-hinge helix DNA binding protein